MKPGRQANVIIQPLLGTWVKVTLLNGDVIIGTFVSHDRHFLHLHNDAWTEAQDTYVPLTALQEITPCPMTSSGGLK